MKRSMFKYILGLMLVGSAINVAENLFNKIDELEGNIESVEQTAEEAKEKAEEALAH